MAEDRDVTGYNWPKDRWEKAKPEEMGFNGELLSRLDTYAAAHLPKLLSFLLIRRGYMVMERYYGGADQETLMDIRSVTKSFTGSAVGLAFRDGLITDPSAPVGDLVPDGFFPAGGEARKITVHELLTMQSGLYWKTGNKLGEAYIYRLHRSKDWLRFILRLPVDPAMRGKFLYRSPDSHLLSCLISYASGEKLSRFLHSRLFEPLGIRHYEWPDDPQGHTAGHVFLRMASRDLAKLGLIYLAGGRWNKEALLMEDWIRACLSPQTEALPFYGSYGSYGYQWWNSRVGGRKAAYALGHGGNFIMILPELECVAVATSDPRVNRWRDPRQLVEKFVIPAFEHKLAEQGCF